MENLKKCKEVIKDIEVMLENKQELKPQDIERLRNLPDLIMKVAVNGERITFHSTIARGRAVRSISFREVTLTYYKQNENDRPVLQRVIVKGGYHNA